MERVPVRTRESRVTLSAWRAQLEGGAIVLVEIAGRSVYRGEGAFLGATQERLAEAWQAAIPKGDPEPDNPPLG
jgi:hypothetical protein